MRTRTQNGPKQQNIVSSFGPYIMKVDLATPYFHGRFLKAKPGAKADGALLFSPPKTPVEFSLIVDHEIWMEAEDY